jgi:coenzyme PQQ synthesis protein D (PqqD)
VDHIVMSADVIVREVDGESVFLDLKTQRYLGTDEIGTRMWNLLKESGSIELTANTLAQEYDVEPGRIESDVQDFVEELIRLGLAAPA